MQVPFTPGRTDASAEQTDVNSFEVLEPTFDGFRNHLAKGHNLPAEHLLVERAARLDLSAPEMTVLVGGMRALDANTGQSQLGVLTKTPGTLTNDFFVNVLDMGTVWAPITDTEETFEGRDLATGEARWTASRADLVFGSNSELRALAEKGVNIQVISTSEIKISVLIDAAYTELAVRALHAAYGLDQL